MAHQLLARSVVEGALVEWFGEQRLLGLRLPVALLPKEDKAAELRRVVAAEAMIAAYKAELILGLADDTPDTLDPPPGSPGAGSRSWVPDGELPGVSDVLHGRAVDGAQLRPRDHESRRLSTTSSRTPAAARPTARTSAACAAATTGSRRMPAAGPSR